MNNEEVKVTNDSQNEGDNTLSNQDDNSNPANPNDKSPLTEFNQSPVLDDMELPPVKNRLPINPKLTNEMPPDMLDYEIGRYGGTLTTVTAQVDWDADFFVLNNEALLNSTGILGD